MARPKSHTAEVRERLIARALEDVRAEGLGALVLRDLAQRADTSTRAVYSLFGSKEALQLAVLTEVFTAFGDDQRLVPQTDDPAEDIAGLGARYVQWALDHPRLYEAMFGESLTAMQPSPELDAARERAFSGLFEAVRRAIASGHFRPADEATVAASLWAQVHGLTSLMIAGQLPQGADPASAALAAIRGWSA